MKGAVAKAEDIAASDPKYVLLQQFKNPVNPAIHETTTGPEIWDDTNGAIDILVSGVGTGGTITGVARFIKRTKGKAIRSIAVEPTASSVLTQMLAGEELEPGPHKIQGIGAGFVPDVLDLSLVDAIEQVSNEEAVHFRAQAEPRGRHPLGHLVWRCSGRCRTPGTPAGECWQDHRRCAAGFRRTLAQFSAVRRHLRCDGSPGGLVASAGLLIWARCRHGDGVNRIAPVVRQLAGRSPQAGVPVTRSYHFAHVRFLHRSCLPVRRLVPTLRRVRGCPEEGRGRVLGSRRRVALALDRHRRRGRSARRLRRRDFSDDRHRRYAGGAIRRSAHAPRRDAEPTVARQSGRCRTRWCMARGRSRGSGLCDTPARKGRSRVTRRGPQGRGFECSPRTCVFRIC